MLSVLLGVIDSSLQMVTIAAVRRMEEKKKEEEEKEGELEKEKEDKGAEEEGFIHQPIRQSDV